MPIGGPLTEADWAWVRALVDRYLAQIGSVESDCEEV